MNNFEQSAEKSPEQMANEAIEVLLQSPIPEELLKETLSKIEEAKRLASPELRMEIEKRHVLANHGMESVEQLNEEIENLGGEEKQESEADDEYQLRQEMVNAFKEALKQIEEIK